ncbi:hypothetical protein LCGC14_0723970 [marine sediment metagenome]|uniref:Uncharacterized protein n=1 Tax=marine sediment metagenome TaxID=412755 RepID=A0A0F9SWV3_9ZZZZ
MSDHIRGTQAIFAAEFFDFDGAPMTPADAESWPAVVIRDPDGTVVVTGVGMKIADGRYQFGWFVPTSATMTAEGLPWTIDWSFVTSNGHTRAETEKFGVVDRIESTPEERSHTYLTNNGGTIRATIRSERKLEEVVLTVKNTGGGTLYTVAGVATNAVQSNNANPNRLVNEVAQDGEYLYYYDVGPLTSGEYQLHWNILESVVSERHVIVQIVRAAPDIFWHYNAELRTLIDKLQKSQSIQQAYTDADVYSYVKGGLDILNFYNPPTDFVLGDIPLTGSRGLRTALIYTSAIHAINAQQILEIELSFDHSGQTVTLGYNHDYSGVLSNLQAVLERFAESKMHIFRKSQGAAFSGARIKNYRWTNRVFRLDRSLRGIVPPGGAALWRNLGI